MGRLVKAPPSVVGQRPINRRAFPLNSSLAPNDASFPLYTSSILSQVVSSMSLPVSHYFLQRWGTTPLPRLIDELAELCPNQPMVSLPRDNGRPAEGYRDYSINEFARAVNRAAWWIEQQLGRAPTRWATLHYVAPQDLSYFIITLAAVKTGYKVRAQPLLPAISTSLTLACRP